MEGVAPLSTKTCIGVSSINQAGNIPLSLYCIVWYGTWLILAAVLALPTKYMACGMVSISMSEDI